MSLTSYTPELDAQVCGLARSLARGPRHRLDRDDVVQIGRLAALEAIEQRGERKVGIGYIKQAVRWRIADAYRSINRDTLAKHETYVEEVYERERQHNPISEVGGNMLVEELLAHVRPVEREVIMLIDFEDATYAAASDILGIPQGTVAPRRARGLAKMRAYLEATCAA